MLQMDISHVITDEGKDIDFLTLCVCVLRVLAAVMRRFWRSRCVNSEKNFENSKNCMNKSRRKHAAVRRRFCSFMIR